MDLIKNLAIGIYTISWKILNSVFFLYYRMKYRSIEQQFDKIYSYYTNNIVSVGDNIYVCQKSEYIASDFSLSIDSKTVLGQHVTAFSPNKMKTINDTARCYDIMINEDVWVDKNVMLAKGITISRGTVVLTNSVVRDSFPPYSIIGGVPAQLLGYRFNKEEVEEYELKYYSEDLRLKENELTFLSSDKQSGVMAKMNNKIAEKLMFKSLQKSNHRSNLNLLIEGGRCIIGSKCFFNHNFSLTCLNEIVIGNRCTFGNNVVIVDHDHKKNGKRFTKGRVLIGEGTWVGANSVILKDTIIGKNCIIAAGSIVKGVIPDNSILIQKRTNIVNSL